MASQPLPPVYRPLIGQVRDSNGDFATITFAGCTCEDQHYRDRSDEIHWCGHLVEVYAQPNLLDLAARTGAFTVDVPSRSRRGLVHSVTLLHCTLDGLIGPDGLCEHVTTAYQHHGWQADPADETEVQDAPAA